MQLDGFNSYGSGNILKLIKIWMNKSRYTHMKKRMKKKGGQVRSRQWQLDCIEGPGPFSKVSNLNIAVWIMHENQWNYHMSVLQDLTVVSSFECQNDTLFSLSLYSIFLLFPQKNWVAFQISRCFKILFSLLFKNTSNC